MNHDKEEDDYRKQKRQLKRKQMWRVIRQICRCERCEDADGASYNIFISYQAQNFISRNHCETSRLRSSILGAGVANSAKPRQIVLTSSIYHDCCTPVLHFDHRPSNLGVLFELVNSYK